MKIPQVLKNIVLPMILGVVSAYFLVTAVINYYSGSCTSEKPVQNTTQLTPSPTISTHSVSSPTPKINLISPPQRKILPNGYHTFQTFNNCGPASLSMALSYFGINETQTKLGQDLSPYQHPKGDNDDKYVTLAEIAEKAKEYGLAPFHRPGGDMEKIKLLIAYDIPVITRTWTKVNEDIGHFRVVKGYDDSKKQIIQDDSLQNKNLWFTYDVFNTMWEKFNFEYLVLVPKDKVEIAEEILGEDKDEQKAWKKAAQNAQRKLEANPNDIYSRFNLSVAYYNLGQYERAVEEFEKVEDRLPFRTLWYQIEPIQAYFELGDYKKVFSVTDRVLSNGNRAFSELYLIRGEIYLKQNDKENAKKEFEKAVFYNVNLKSAQEALSSVSTDL